jgi:hypothetical protein
MGVQRIVNRFAVLFVPFPSCSCSPPGYNVIALPLAMTSVITPLIAAVMMAISSLIVVFNSKRRLLPSNEEHSVRLTATITPTGSGRQHTRTNRPILFSLV